MKTSLLYITFIILSLISCNKDAIDKYIVPLNDISACGTEDPLNHLLWLNEKIMNGKKASNTDFIEKVWILNYNNEDVIIIGFGLTSSKYSIFNCTGNILTVENPNFLTSLTDDQLIYKSY